MKRGQAGRSVLRRSGTRSTWHGVQTLARVISALLPVLLLVTVAMPAKADKGVIGAFGGLGTAPGQFNASASNASPRGLAIDQATGDVYVSDGGKHRVVRFDRFGGYLSQIGTGLLGTLGGVFNFTASGAGGIAFDQVDGIGDDGALYVADGSNLRIQKFVAGDVFSLAWGGDVDQPAGGSAAEICSVPSNCKAGASGTADGAFGATFSGYPAVDPTTGNLYVADPGGTGNRRVQRFGPAGSFQLKFGSNGAGAGQFGTQGPSKLAVDSTGAVYAVDNQHGSSMGGNARVQKCVETPPASGAFACANFGPTGSTVTPFAVAVDGDDHVYVARHASGASTEIRVSEFLADGTPVTTHGVGAGLGANASAPGVNLNGGLAVNDATGEIYVSVPATSSIGSADPLHVHRVFVLDEVLDPSAQINNVAAVGAHSAEIQGFVNPNGPDAGPNRTQTSYHLELSTNGDDWAPASAGVALPNGDTPISVSPELLGLEANTQYFVRLVATKPYGAGSDVTSPVTFTTDEAPPEATTLAPSPITASGAELHGRINPNNAPTSYYFEYGASESYGKRIPLSNGDAGGGTPVAVSAAISDLLPNTTYHFRIVAAGNGTTFGADRTFTTLADDAPPPTPGEASERVWERVSPSFKNGSNWNWSASNGDFSNRAIALISEDGSRMQADGTQAFVEPGAQLNQTPFLLERHHDGWRGSSLMPEPNAGFVPDHLAAATSAAGASRDLDHIAIDSPWESASRDDDGPNVSDLYSHRVTSPEEGFELLTCPDDPAPACSSPTAIVASDGAAKGNNMVSPDGSTVLFETAETFIGEDLAPIFPEAVDRQVYARANGALRWVSQPLLTVPTGATQVAGRPSLINATLTSPGEPTGSGFNGVGPWLNPISEDGSRIFFAAPTDSDQSRVYVRVDQERTLEVSRLRGGSGAISQRIKFRGASRDGNRAIFATRQVLLPAAGVHPEASDPNSVLDLYLWTYDPAADPANDAPAALTRIQGLAQVGPGPAADGQHGLSVVGASDDMTRVYFTTDGGGVYLAELPEDDPRSGTVRFIGEIACPATTGVFALRTGVSNCGAASPSGRFFAFASEDQMTPDDLDGGERDVYLYDAVAGSIERASRGAGPGYDDGPFDVVFESFFKNAAIADSGMLFFETGEALVPADVSGTDDVYEYRPGGGHASLVSGGGQHPAASGKQHPVRMLGASADGSSVFFLTLENLVQDSDSAPDIYVARIGGGFPGPGAPCFVLDDQCQEPTGTGQEPTIRTGGFVESGLGNLPRASRGTVRFRRLTVSQRTKLASGRRVSLVVNVTRAGRIAVIGSARIGGRARRVISSRVTTREDGEVRVPIGLTKPARRHLAKTGGLAVTLRVTASGASSSASRRVKFKRSRLRLERRGRSTTARGGVR
jgi:hypothetical protein